MLEDAVARRAPPKASTPRVRTQPMDQPIATRIAFDEIAWTSVGSGAREKIATRGDRRLRLLELTGDFEEDAWCRNAHWGILLEGEMAIEHPTGTEHLDPGDGLALPAEEAARHKASVPTGARALLFLVEPA